MLLFVTTWTASASPGFFLNIFFLHVINPERDIGSPDLGQATTGARAALPRILFAFAYRDLSTRLQ